jgi:hypothetical protein
MKKITITSLAVILSLSIMTTSSHAGNLQRNRTTAFSTRPAASVADYTRSNRNRLSHHGSSYRVNSQYNTNQYRYKRRKVWNPKKNRQAGFPLRSFTNNGNLSNQGNHGHLRPYQRPLQQVDGYHDRNRLRNGHWQIKKIWVPPKRHRIWKPGYSNSIGHRVPGRWIITKIERGHLAEKRVWIPH